MEGFEKLKEIGLEEICNKTHIDCDAVEFILNKDFEKLAKFNVCGFIKILERDFDIDLSDFKDEFEQFKIEHKEISDKIKVWPQLDTYVSNKNSKHFGTFFTILIFILLILFYFYNFKIYEKISLNDIFEDKNRSIIYSDAKIVETVNQKVEIPAVVFANKDENVDFNETKILDNLDENLTKIENQNLDQNLTTKDEILQNPKLIIQPNDEIWIGIIDLKTRAKTSLQTDKNYELNLTKDSLIVTGHGNFDLNESGKITNFNTKNSKRFLIQNGEIKEIKFDEFLKLNGGKNW